MTDFVPWWDWLLCPAAELKTRGLNPAERVHHTGHKRALSSRWAQTIGMWARAEPSSIIETYAPADVDKMRARSAYDVFKHRHRLISRPRFMAKHMMVPDSSVFREIGPVMVATYAHSRIFLHRQRSPLSPGAAAEVGALFRISEDDGRTLIRDALGLLPVEALLYYYAIERIFEETAFDYDQWIADASSGKAWLDRAQYWKRFECDADIALPAAALERYPVVYAEDD